MIVPDEIVRKAVAAGLQGRPGAGICSPEVLFDFTRAALQWHLGTLAASLAMETVCTAAVPMASHELRHMLAAGAAKPEAA